VLDQRGVLWRRSAEGVAAAGVECDVRGAAVAVGGSPTDESALLNAEDLMRQTTALPPDSHGQVTDQQVLAGRVGERDQSSFVTGSELFADGGVAQR
jgi:hypothetical protein